MVDWNKAPADAEYYANGKFFKVDKSCSNCLMLVFANDFNVWEWSAYSMADIEMSCDYQKLPKDKVSINNTQNWTDKHYDNYYHLTEADISSGKIKIDAYFVSNMWKLGEKDNTGVLFHNLKTIARFGDKNDVEREIKALYNQTKRLAELHGVKL